MVFFVRKVIAKFIFDTLLEQFFVKFFLMKENIIM